MRAQDNIYDSSDTRELLNPTFTEASTRANIDSQESHSTILGKIKKFFTDVQIHFFNMIGQPTDKTDPSNPIPGLATLDDNGHIPEGQLPVAYTSNPNMDGTASPGSSTTWSRGDHTHPTDSTRQPKTLDTAITWNGSSRTTVEGLLGAMTASLGTVQEIKYVSSLPSDAASHTKTLYLIP